MLINFVIFDTYSNFIILSLFLTYFWHTKTYKILFVEFLAMFSKKETCEVNKKNHLFNYKKLIASQKREVSFLVVDTKIKEKSKKYFFNQVWSKNIS